MEPLWSALEALQRRARLLAALEACSTAGRPLLLEATLPQSNIEPGFLRMNPGRATCVWSAKIRYWVVSILAGFRASENKPVTLKSDRECRLEDNQVGAGDIVGSRS